ncbi:MAG: hypothetical protein IPK82_22960 [Polyangiaceae bacterium]|nr:hypothetical protein [Polyangiaceae bacterium]
MGTSNSTNLPLDMPLPPAGWSLVDQAFLQERRDNLTEQFALTFFDGRNPGWREALSDNIPRRQIVSELLSILVTAQDRGLHLTLLTGAAGEGKSTALLQSVCDFVQQKPEVGVYFRHGATQRLPIEFLKRLPFNRRWLIVSDDAEIIASAVYQGAQALSALERDNIQFFLTARDTDWQAEGADRWGWKNCLTLQKKELRGLIVEDAEKIVQGWQKAGDKGLGNLRDLPIAEAVARLTRAAAGERPNPRDGAFLGALLQVRWGAGLSDHIRTLLEKFEQQQVGKTHLLHAFAYVCAMHAEHLPALSREVLAEALFIETADLDRLVLTPLGEEAAIAATGRHVFARHRAIAQEAIQILYNDYSLDLDVLYAQLVEAAIELFLRSGKRIPTNIKDWNYLSKYFFDVGHKERGILLAKRALDTDPENRFLLVQLARLHRQNGDPERSVAVFKAAVQTTKLDRACYYEWATSAGSAEMFAVDAYLSAFSLSDECERLPPDLDRAILSLRGLCTSFTHLHRRYRRPAFLNAVAAAAQLGLTLHLEASVKYDAQSNEQAFRDSMQFAIQRGAQPVAPGAALANLYTAVADAWALIEESLSTVLPPEKLHFSGLARLFNL